MEIPLWKASQLPCNSVHSPYTCRYLHGRWLLLLLFADPSPFIYTEQFQHSWGFLRKTILQLGLEEILQQLRYLAKEICV